MNDSTDANKPIDWSKRKIIDPAGTVIHDPAWYEDKDGRAQRRAFAVAYITGHAGIDAPDFSAAAREAWAFADAMMETEGEVTG